MATGLCFGSAEAEDFRLSNGLRVIIEPRPTTETVALRLLIAGGDAGDPSSKAAVARLHAALLLRGTRERTGFALARAAEELGGRLSAYSRPLAESVTLSLPAENVETGLRLVAEVLLQPRLDAPDLEKEKTLLLGSLATARDDPSTFRRDEIYRTLFRGHSFQRLALPSAEEVRAVQIEDVREFHRAHQDARRLALIVVGRCSEKRLAILAEELFGKVPSGTDVSGSVAVKVPAPAALPADASRHVSRRTMQPEISVALPTAGIADAEASAYELLRHVLGGFQERLYDEIREKRGWAYWVTAEGLAVPGAGCFAVTTGAQKEHLSDIEKIIRAELTRIAASPASAEERTRAVRYLRTEEARRDATNAGRVSVIAEQLVAGSPPRTYEERVSRLEGVSPLQIQALAHRLFAGKHLAIVTMY
ncbi:MAG TPA: pitrilysin family protein [Thermoanaerobaculia bacterium]|nr:pitrilysin family protein [Thermoanaerobaculia bacterium]